jgi:hypothetical protein
MKVPLQRTISSKWKNKLTILNTFKLTTHSRYTTVLIQNKRAKKYCSAEG